MKRYKILFMGAFFVFLTAANAFSADLKQLMEIGASQADIAKTLQQETKNYNEVKKAIASGAIKEGMPADAVRKRYGGPILDTYDKKHDATKWLYMPASSNHFKGEKLYLYIDKDNKVKSWELIEG